MGGVGNARRIRPMKHMHRHDSGTLPRGVHWDPWRVCKKRHTPTVWIRAEREEECISAGPSIAAPRKAKVSRLISCVLLQKHSKAWHGWRSRRALCIPTFLASRPPLRMSTSGAIAGCAPVAETPRARSLRLTGAGAVRFLNH